MSLTNFIKNRNTLSQLYFAKPTVSGITSGNVEFQLYRPTTEPLYYSCPVLWIKNVFEPVINFIQFSINGKTLETIHSTAFLILYKKIEQHIVRKGEWMYIPLPFLTLWNDCIKQTENMDCRIIINSEDILIEAELQIFNTFVQQESTLDRLSAIIRCIPTGGFDFIQEFHHVQMQHSLLEQEIEMNFANNINEILFQISDLNGNVKEHAFDALSVVLNDTQITAIDESRLGIFKNGAYYSVPLFGGYGNDYIDMSSNRIKLQFKLKEDIGMNYKVVIIAFAKSQIKYFESSIIIV